MEQQNLMARPLKQSTTVTARLPADVREAGDKIFARDGLKPSEAIRLIYEETIRRGQFPFDIERIETVLIDRKD